MRKYFLILGIILCWNVAFCGESGNRDWMNPEYTWIYNQVCDVRKNPTDLAEYSLIPMQLKVMGNENREGKEFRKLSWKIELSSTEIMDLSYFLLREENGAWYTYVEYGDLQFDSEPSVAQGEYLLYDFNMEPGDSFEAPISTQSGFVGMAFHEEDCRIDSKLKMCHFTIKNKSLDEYGRRVLELSCDAGEKESMDFPKEITVVEGIGGLKNGNLAMYFFPENTPEMFNRSVEFYELVCEDGSLIYLDPNEYEAGFVTERDYTWIYGVYDSEGKLYYHKMGFDYYEKVFDNKIGKSIAFRRFGTFGVSEYPDGPWQIVPFDARDVRAEDGKVWLSHSSKNTENNEILTSLIYDFNAPNASELTVFTSEGDKTISITTGQTRVDEKEVRSYTFDGSDGVKCVDGIGIVKGGILPCLNTEYQMPVSEYDTSYCSAVLIAVYDCEGNLIFSQNMPSKVSTLINSDIDTTRIFDLMGRELSEPIPGHPFIKGGKILVEK